MTRILERLAILVLALLLASGPTAQGSAFPGGRATVTALGGIAFALWLASVALRPTRLAARPTHHPLAPNPSSPGERFSLSPQGHERDGVLYPLPLEGEGWGEGAAGEAGRIVESTATPGGPDSVSRAAGAAPPSPRPSPSGRGRTAVESGWWPYLWPIAPLALVAWILVSTLSAGTHAVALKQGALFASVLLAGIAAFGTLTTERRRHAFGAWLVLVGLAMGGYGVAQRLGYGFTLRVSESQVSSTYFNPSHYTGFVTLALPVALWAVFFHRNLLVKLLGLLAAGALTYTLAFTDSSSLPTTMLATAGAVTVWLWRLWCPAGVLLAAALLVGSIGIARVVTDPSQAARLDATAHSLGLNNTVEGFLKGRRPLWKLDAKAAAAAPLTGVGPGGFIHFAPRFRPERRDETAGSTFNLVNYAHNDYYQMWVELGLPGLALYLLVIAATLLAATRTDPLGATIAIALACLWLSGLWDGHATVIPGTMAWAWTLTGIAARPSSLPVPAATA